MLDDLIAKVLQKCPKRMNNIVSLWQIDSLVRFRLGYENETLVTINYPKKSYDKLLLDP